MPAAAHAALQPDNSPTNCLHMFETAAAMDEVTSKRQMQGSTMVQSAPVALLLPHCHATMTPVLLPGSLFQKEMCSGSDYHKQT